MVPLHIHGYEVLHGALQELKILYKVPYKAEASTSQASLGIKLSCILENPRLVKLTYKTFAISCSKLQFVLRTQKGFYFQLSSETICTSTVKYTRFPKGI